MRQIVLILSYDGRAYHGWQIQHNGRTVQEAVQRAASKIVHEPVHVIGCGRTDAGVHARIYAASFQTRGTIPISRVPAAFNSLLPRDIAVHSALEAPLSFHPIRSCLRKEYTYLIDTSPVRDPFLNGRALHCPHALDIPLLSQAAQGFVGTHDFAAMRSLGTDVSSTVRTVYAYQVWQTGSLVRFAVQANGFLYNMARTMAGTLLQVAAGKLRPEDIPQLLQRGDRSLAGPTAPACGLYMTRLWFDELPELREIGYEG